MHTTSTPIKALAPNDVFWFSASPASKYRVARVRSGAGQTTVDYTVEGAALGVTTFTKPSLTYVVVAG